MGNNINIGWYKPTNKDKFFFDANIWICLLIPALSHSLEVENKYADFLTKIKSSNAEILTSFIVVSEFVNRYLRFKLDEYNKKNGTILSYSAFKDLPEYKKEFEFINKVVKDKMLKISTPISDFFEDLNINPLIYGYSKGCDLNDNYIMTLAEYLNCYIVSRDKYLCNSDIKITVFSDYVS